MIRHGLFASLALVFLAACSAGAPTSTTGPLSTGGAPTSGASSPAAETTPAETSGAGGTPGSSLTAVCVAALSVKQSILALNQLDVATASLQQIHNDVLTVRTAYQNFLVQAREQAQSQMAALQSAVDDLKNADSDLPAGATPKQAFDALRAKIDGVLNALDNVGSALGCPVVD
jgi:hypothetical protein